MKVLVLGTWKCVFFPLKKDSLNNTDPSLMLQRDPFQGSLIRCDSSQSLKPSVCADILGQGESRRSLSSLLLSSDDYRTAATDSIFHNCDRKQQNWSKNMNSIDPGVSPVFSTFLSSVQHSATTWIPSIYSPQCWEKRTVVGEMLCFLRVSLLLNQL